MPSIWLCGGLPEARRGNRPACGVGVRSFPPHPSPLPKEREHHRPACCGCGALRFIARRDTILPLPEGEGRGEGKGDGGTTHVLRMGFDIRLLPERLMALRSEEHTSELQSLRHLVCRLLLEKK